MDYCKKPCHDCPFRADIRPYQSRDDVRTNIATTLLVGKATVCHHAWFRQGREVACAGSILFRRRYGLADPFPCPDVRAGRAVIFTSRVELTVRGLCPDQSAEGRWWAWWMNQPAHVKARLLLEGQHPRTLGAAS